MLSFRVRYRPKARDRFGLPTLAVATCLVATVVVLLQSVPPAMSAEKPPLVPTPDLTLAQEAAQTKSVYSAWDKLMKDERDGKYKDAYDQAAGINLVLEAWNGKTTYEDKKLDRAAALAHLKSLITLQRAEALLESEDWDGAKTTLETLLLPKQPVEARFDSAVLSRASTLLANTVSPELQRPWEERINTANRLLKRGLAEEAIGLFADDPWKIDKAPVALRAEVAQVLLCATSMKATGSWSYVGAKTIKMVIDQADKLFLALGVFLLYLAVIAIQWFWFFTYNELQGIQGLKKSPLLRKLAPRARTTTYIDLKNLSRQGDDEKKDASADRQLASRLAQAVDAICAGHYRHSDESEAVTLAESAQPTLKALPSMDLVVETKTPLSIGTFNLNFAPVLLWLQKLVSTRRFATHYTGTLRAINTVDDTGYELFMQRRGGKCAPKHFYAYDHQKLSDPKTAAPDTAIIDRLINNMAFQIVVAAEAPEESRATDSAMSLQCYANGMDKLEAQLEGDAPRDSLKEAVNQFRLALAYDRDNWLALYYLGFALRRLGRYLDAAAAFGLVNDLLATPDDGRRSTGRRHLAEYYRSYQCLPALLQWNAYDSRARSDDIGILKLMLGDSEDGVDSLIDELLKACNPNEKQRLALSPGQGGSHNPGACRLLWLCRSAKITALAHLQELVNDEKERADYQRAVEAIWNEFNAVTAKPSQDIRALAQAAYGRVRYVRGELMPAIAMLWNAANGQLSFRDPDPYEMLASIYIEKKDEASTMWAEKARRCIDEVRAIQPGTESVSLLDARLWFELKNYAKAQKEAEAAGYSPSAIALRANIAKELLNQPKE